MTISSHTQLQVHSVIRELFKHSGIPKLLDKHGDFILPLPGIIMRYHMEERDDIKIIESGRRLGYFLQQDCHAIVLCEREIHDTAFYLGIDPEKLALITYIHESAHYFHFHARKKFEEASTSFIRKIANKLCFSKLKKNRHYDLFNQTSKFVESFAQLITHKVCEILDEKYQLLETYLHLLRYDPLVYRAYYKGAPIITNMYLYPQEAIFRTFIESTPQNGTIWNFHQIINQLEKYRKEIAIRRGGSETEWETYGTTFGDPFKKEKFLN